MTPEELETVAMLVAIGLPRGHATAHLGRVIELANAPVADPVERRARAGLAVLANDVREVVSEWPSEGGRS